MSEPWKRTPDDGYHYFFGYYDRNPWNDTIDRHLCIRAAQLERLPVPGETATIGMLDGSGDFEPLATTRAWCAQQGSMQLFLPGTNRFIYNDFDGTKIVSRIQELGSGVIGQYNRGIYAISPDGRFGVSLDFGRIPRRGYSYADVPVPWDIPHPPLDEDGIWRVELATGRETLLASYREMLQAHPWRYSTETRYLWLNHAICNCDSTRVLWLLRQCLPPTDAQTGCKWQTFLYTCSMEGGDVSCVLPDTYWSNIQVTHQIWGRTPHEILVDANWDGDGNAAVVFDESVRPFRAERLSRAHGRPSHMVFSRDGKWLLADTCIPVEGRKHLYLIDVADGSSRLIGDFQNFHPAGVSGELRCDLHPRWSPDGHKITVDSVDSGKRAVYLFEL